MSHGSFPVPGVTVGVELGRLEGAAEASTDREGIWLGLFEGTGVGLLESVGAVGFAVRLGSNEGVFEGTPLGSNDGCPLGIWEGRIISDMHSQAESISS